MFPKLLYFLLLHLASFLFLCNTYKVYNNKVGLLPLKKTKNVVFEKTKTFSEKDTQEQVAHLDSYQFCSLKFLHGSYY